MLPSIVRAFLTYQQPKCFYRETFLSSPKYQCPTVTRGVKQSTITFVVTRSEMKSQSEWTANPPAHFEEMTVLKEKGDKQEAEKS